MNDEREQPNRQVLFLEELIDQHARVAGDINAIDTQTWAIHGTILVDGDVIMAEFDHLDEARAVLEQLRPGLAQQPRTVPNAGSESSLSDSSCRGRRRGWPLSPCRLAQR